MESSSTNVMLGEESKTNKAGGVDIKELLSMNAERQQIHNNSIDVRVNHQVNTDSMGGNTHTFHTDSYRSHATSSQPGHQGKLEYTD